MAQFPVESLHAESLPVGSGVWLEDEHCDGELSQFVKVVEHYDCGGPCVTLETEPDHDRWGGHLPGELIERRLPLRGVVQP